MISCPSHDKYAMCSAILFRTSFSLIMYTLSWNCAVGTSLFVLGHEGESWIVLSSFRSLVLSSFRSLVLSFSRSLVLSFSRSLVLSFSRSLVLSFSRSLVLSHRQILQPSDPHYPSNSPIPCLLHPAPRQYLFSHLFKRFLRTDVHLGIESRLPRERVELAIVE